MPSEPSGGEEEDEEEEEENEEGEEEIDSDDEIMDSDDGDSLAISLEDSESEDDLDAEVQTTGAPGLLDVWTRMSDHALRLGSCLLAFLCLALCSVIRSRLWHHTAETPDWMAFSAFFKTIEHGEVELNSTSPL